MGSGYSKASGNSLKTYNKVITYAKFKQQIDHVAEVDAIDREILKKDPNYKISKYFFADKPRDTIVQLYVKNGKYTFDVYKDKKSVAKGLNEKQVKETVAKITENTRFFKLLEEDRKKRKGI